MIDMKNVSLYIEANPNPQSLKFVANEMLVPEGKSYDFESQEAAKEAPLAHELFSIPFVERVFYMSNFVTVTKNPEVSWEAVREDIRLFIKEYLDAEKPLLTENYADPNAGDEDTDIDIQIRSILDEYIKPAVEMDGGAITYRSFEDGIVKVYLQGACSGCPSSTVTLKMGIENLLKSKIPEVKAVEAEGI